MMEDYLKKKFGPDFKLNQQAFMILQSNNTLNETNIYGAVSRNEAKDTSKTMITEDSMMQTNGN